MELCRFVATPARHAVAKGPLPLRSTAAPLLPRRTLAVRSPAEPRVPRGRLLGASGIDEVSYVRATERKVETAAGGREGERGATKGEEGTVIEYEEAPLGGVEVLDFLKNIDLKEQVETVVHSREEREAANGMAEGQVDVVVDGRKEREIEKERVEEQAEMVVDGGEEREVANERAEEHVEVVADGGEEREIEKEREVAKERVEVVADGGEVREIEKERVEEQVEMVAGGREDGEVAKERVEEQVEMVVDGREEREVAKGEEGTVLKNGDVAMEAPMGEVEVLDFPKDIDLKLDSGDMYPILLYGTGAFVALWVSSAVVGALDALPLIPKVLEIVGLGFAVWFSYRYLVFKKNRDELSAKIQDLKEEILGPSDSYNY